VPDLAQRPNNVHYAQRAAQLRAGQHSRWPSSPVLHDCKHRNNSPADQKHVCKIMRAMCQAAKLLVFVSIQVNAIPFNHATPRVQLRKASGRDRGHNDRCRSFGCSTRQHSPPAHAMPPACAANMLLACAKELALKQCQAAVCLVKPAAGSASSSSAIAFGAEPLQQAVQPCVTRLSNVRAATHVWRRPAPHTPAACSSRATSPACCLALRMRGRD
jgi:hypothetical protein